MAFFGNTGNYLKYKLQYLFKLIPMYFNFDTVQARDFPLNSDAS